MARSPETILLKSTRKLLVVEVSIQGFGRPVVVKGMAVARMNALVIFRSVIYDLITLCMERKLVLFFALIVMTAGCSGRRDIYSLRPLEQAESIDDISTLIDRIDLINLEESEESTLVYPTKIVVLSDGSLILKDSGSKILKFDSKGNYVCRIGARGRAKSEYNKVQDICIDKGNENICVLDLGRIVIYDHQDGSYIRSIEIPHHNYDEFCPDDNNGFWLFCAAPDYDTYDFTDSFMTLHHISSQGGDPFEKCVPRQDYIMNVSLLSRSVEGFYYLRPLEGENILYRISNDVNPLLTIDYGGLSCPPHYMINEGKPDFSRYLLSEYYKNVMYYHDTAKDTYFAVIGPNAAVHNYIFSKDTYRCVGWQDPIDDDTPSIIMDSDANAYYVMVFAAKEYMQKPLNQLSPLNRAIVSHIKDKQHELNDNPLIAKVHFMI